ncbi:hypothetical protein C8R44DRAFT_952939 [Mycena epipterygia]|nr:hypothetical protein C8R44DRAFT_952939 [Mycena epipterygia]
MFELRYFYLVRSFFNCADRLVWGQTVSKSLCQMKHPEAGRGQYQISPNLAARGVDLLDVSSGFIHLRQKLKGGPEFQAHLSEAIKASKPARLVVSTVGNITTGVVAQQVLNQGQADVIFVGKQFLEKPGAVWAFAKELGVDITLTDHGFSSGAEREERLETKERYRIILFGILPGSLCFTVEEPRRGTNSTRYYRFDLEPSSNSSSSR